MKKILLLALISTLFSCGSLIYPSPKTYLNLKSPQLHANGSKLFFIASCNNPYPMDYIMYNSNIYSFDFKNLKLQKITNNKSEYSTLGSAFLSSEKDQILFETNETKSLINIIDLEGKDILQFEGSNPIWSPNANKIIFSKYNKNDNSSDYVRKLFIINSDGTNQQELKLNYTYHNWANNNEIIFSDEKNNIFTFNIETNNKKYLNITGIYPRSSSDGNKIAFFLDERFNNLIITNSLGEKLFEILNTTFPLFSYADGEKFRWKNNKLIVSAYDNKFINNIHLINTDEKTVTKLTSNKAEHREFYNGILFDNESKLFYIDSKDWGRMRFKTLDLKSKEVKDLLTDEIYRTLEKDCK